MKFRCTSLKKIIYENIFFFFLIETNDEVSLYVIEKNYI